MTKQGSRMGMARLDVGACTAVAACVGVWYVFGLGPTLAAHREQSDTKQQIEQQRQSIRDAQSRLIDIQERLESARRAEEAVAFRLGQSGQINSRVDAIATLANQAGLRLDSMRPGDAVPSTRYTAVSIALAGTGSYTTAVRFLRELREQFPDMGVRGFELRAQTPGPAGIVATVSLDLVWYTEPTLGPSPSARSSPTVPATTAEVGGRGQAP